MHHENQIYFSLSWPWTNTCSLSQLWVLPKCFDILSILSIYGHAPPLSRSFFGLHLQPEQRQRSWVVNSSPSVCRGHVEAAACSDGPATLDSDKNSPLEPKALTIFRLVTESFIPSLDSKVRVWGQYQGKSKSPLTGRERVQPTKPRTSLKSYLKRA
jgi:hypothetical protein